MIIHKPQLCTTLEIWTPRYHDKYDGDGWVALLAQYKVMQSSPVILVNFSKAKHLAGQRFAIKREDVMRCQLDTNGKIPCYAVPMAMFEQWESAQEVRDLAFSLFE